MRIGRVDLILRVRLSFAFRRSPILVDNDASTNQSE